MKYYTQKDLDILKPLLEQVVQMAASKENALIIKRWRDVNAKRKVDMPPVYCMLDREAWEEIIVPESLECSDLSARAMEENLKWQIYKRVINDDTPAYDFIGASAVYDVTPENTWGLESKIIRTVEPGAYTWEPSIKEVSDYAKVVMPTYKYNEEKTIEKTEKLTALTQGILKVVPSGDVPCGITLDYQATYLRGIAQLLMDLILNPKEVKKLFRLMTDAYLQAAEYVNSLGLVTPGNLGATFESDPFGPVSEDRKYSTLNRWAVLSGQDFDSVSPSMWEEFLLPYQIEMAKTHGKVIYGCCENLTKKVKGVLKIPNLALFTCSIFTDLQTIIDNAGDKHVIQWRQSPVDLFINHDLSILDEHLRKGARSLKGCSYQVVLREVQTVNNNAHRMRTFTDMVKNYGVKYM